MKFHLILLSVIVGSLHVSFNLAELTVGTFADPSHPGQCVVLDLLLAPGTVARHPDMCAKITCHEGSKASIVTCPAMVPPKDCTIGEQVNPKANYPNCCRKKIICKNGIKFNS